MTDAAATIALIQTRATEQRKFDASEVTPDLREVALAWLAKYEGSFDFLNDLKVKSTRYELSDGQVKGVLNCMLAALRQKAAAPAPTAKVVEDGMYQMADGTIVKVQIAKNGSGNLYAKELVQDGPRSWTFVYKPGLIRKLTADMKLSLDEAKKFGQLYGICCVCSRDLTDEVSIANGIGPVCEGRL